ncbi:hypothetical protein ACROYT_G008737 [Oculina patagonica]
MKLEDFSSVVLGSDILTKKEIASMTDCLGSASSFPVKFSATKRRGFQVDGDIQRCCRFGSPSACGWSYTGSTDAISFSVDKDIVLHGVCFFGNENKAYSVDLKGGRLRKPSRAFTKPWLSSKFVLSISSPVFEAMFYGELAETGDSIELPDCEYDSLLELFRYMYSDEVHLSGSNVMGVLYLAKKYIVPSLADKCTEYLKDNLDPSNVFSILPSARKYDEKNLVDQC